MTTLSSELRVRSQLSVRFVLQQTFFGITRNLSFDAALGYLIVTEPKVK